MKFSTTSIAGDVEILASKDFQAIPIKVADPSGTPGLVKAGTPLTSAGVSTTGSSAVGILLYDVDTRVNPNGAIVVQGIIDATKAQAHSGVSYNTSNLKSALPGVILRDNIKALKGNADLLSIEIGSLTLVPDFNKGVYSYETSTTSTSDTITVSAADENATAVIKNGDTTVTSGNAATWSSTNNTVTVTVTAEDGVTEQVYTVAVTKS